MVRGFPFFSARAAAALSLLGLLVAALVVPAFASEWAVVGGGPADPAAWPSTVALIRADATDDVAGQFCTGTAVAEDLVLTAAHCFSSITGEQSRTAADVRVVAGRADLTDRSVGTDRLGVDLYVHPDFMAASHRNDVALLRVDAPLEVPIQRLAEAGRATPAPDTVGVILGWGRTGPGPEASSSSTAVLHEAHVPIVAAATCADAFDPSPDPSLHICAGGGGTEDAPEPDACRGDSGGPLLFPVADEPAEQFGITAFGSTECGVGQPGVYASVSAARPFIDDVIAGLEPFRDDRTALGRPLPQRLLDERLRTRRCKPEGLRGALDARKLVRLQPLQHRHQHLGRQPGTTADRARDLQFKARGQGCG